MYFDDYLVLSNGTKWEDFSITSTFWVFLVKIWVFQPLGYPLIGFFYAIDIEEIAPMFILNVFLWLLCIILYPKLGDF